MCTVNKLNKHHTNSFVYYQKRLLGPRVEIRPTNKPTNYLRQRNYLIIQGTFNTLLQVVAKTRDEAQWLQLSHYVWPQVILQHDALQPHSSLTRGALDVINNALRQCPDHPHCRRKLFIRSWNYSRATGKTLVLDVVISTTCNSVLRQTNCKNYW